MNKIKNKAEFEIELCGKKHKVETLETVVEPIKIDIIQKEPCKYVLENDKIKYLFEVKNLSRTDIFGGEFKDILSHEVDYVNESFEINGKKENAEVCGNVLIHKIKELKACETLYVSFEVKTREFKNQCEKCGCERPERPHCPCGCYKI